MANILLTLGNAGPETSLRSVVTSDYKQPECDWIPEQLLRSIQSSAPWPNHCYNVKDGLSRPHRSNRCNKSSRSCRRISSEVAAKPPQFTNK
ncbi:hypothetical protein ACTXT7_014159 [Hymenolepis weldensis]